MNYREALDWLYSTQMFGIKLGLEGPTRLLRKFLAFPSPSAKVIQVAGTNGKGSTCAFIDSIARSCGVRTGLFTSPHLVDYTERIQVSGREIPQEKCAELLTELHELAKTLDPHPTFFEISLALAMRYFYETSVELIILETGMGGRLDATTAVPTHASIITPIGLDHTQWLGDTIEAIALEKAGIMRKDVPCFSAQQLPEAKHTLLEYANETRTPLEFITQPVSGYSISLSGEHQNQNAALALAALHSLHYPLSFDSVQSGLKSARLLGRFDILKPTSTNRAADLVIDAAHNPHAATMLAATWQKIYGKQKSSLIFGAVADKDIRGILEKIAPVVSEVHLVPVNSERALSVEKLTALIAQSTLADKTVYAHISLDHALSETATENSPTLLTGSLFLVGEALAHLNRKEYRSSAQ